MENTIKIVNQVYKTNDYSVFNTIKGNRPLNKLHKKRLMESMTIQHLQSPIIVNKNMDIIAVSYSHLTLPTTPYV